jgi:hypothetical protein
VPLFEVAQGARAGNAVLVPQKESNPDHRLQIPFYLYFTIRHDDQHGDLLRVFWAWAGIAVCHGELSAVSYENRALNA